MFNVHSDQVLNEKKCTLFRSNSTRYCLSLRIDVFLPCDIVSSTTADLVLLQVSERIRPGECMQSLI